MRTRLLHVFLLLTPVGTQAQDVATAVATDDRIYALAVDPADHVGRDFVYILEDGRVQIEADGRVTYSMRQVVQVLTPAGAAQWGDFAIAFDPERQDLRLDRLRVVEDGVVVREGPEYQQVSSRPVDQNAPVYDDYQVLQATIAGVRPGTMVDYVTTIETFEPRLPGDVLYRWNLNGTDPVLRSRFQLDTPDGLELRIGTTGPVASPEVEVRDGRRVRTWSSSDQEAIDVEPYAGFPNDVVLSVYVSGTLDWDDIGTWYAPFLADPPELSDDLVAAHEAVLGGAVTLRDSLSATYRWVAQDFRYVSLSLGDGGYRPRSPQEVFETGFGDCKDKTTLFIALAQRLGLDAWPILVNSSGGVERARPSLKQFDHMIAAVEFEDEPVYFDVTSTLVPFGLLPPALDGDVGLSVRPSGSSELVALPASDPAENTFVEEVVGQLGLDNRFVGSVTIAATGNEQYPLRSGLFRFDNQDNARRDAFLTEIAQNVYASAVVDSSRVLDGADLDGPAQVTVWFTASEILGTAGSRYLMYLPVGSYAYSESTRATVRDDDDRRFPIDVGLVNSPSVYRSETRVQLPAGWSVELPSDVLIDGDFGYYDAAFSQRGDTLVVSREMGGDRGLLPPDRVDDLAVWLDDVSSDAAEYVLIDPQGAPLGSQSPEYTADLASVLPSIEDFGPGAVLASDGQSGVFEVANFSTAMPLRTHGRDFAAEQMAFSLGESPLMLMSTLVAEFRTKGEAAKDLHMLRLIELGPIFGSMMADEVGSQMTVGEVRPLEIPSIDQFHGSVIDLVTPVVTFEMTIGLMVEGRVTTTVFAMGPQGMRGDDLEVVLQGIADRIRSNDELMEDQEIVDDPETRVDRDALTAAAEGLPLHQMLPDQGDIPNVVRYSEELETSAVTTLTRSLEGIEFTFPYSGVDIMGVELSVRLLKSEGWTVKGVLMDARDDLEAFVEEQDEGMDFFTSGMLEGDSNEFELGPPLDFLPFSRSSIARFRSIMHVDLGLVSFAMGRLVVTIQARAPAGTLSFDVLGDLAADVERRIIAVAPEMSGSQPSAELVERVEQLMEHEDRVRQLVDERDFETLLPLMEGLNLDYTDLTFEMATFNSVCWWGALEGSAEAVLPYCEAALVPDPEWFPGRDSRGVARGIAGDLEGAEEDLSWVADHAVEGEFRSLRLGWVRALRAGENPFTEEVLESLRN